MLVLIAGLMIGPCLSSELRAFTAEDALQMRAYSLFNLEPSLSADGRYVAYTVWRAPTTQECLACIRGDQSYGADVWISDLLKSSSTNVTANVASNWSPQWSPDGEQLAFVSDRGGHPALWLWARASGALRQISNAEVFLAMYHSPYVTWRSDGHTLVVPLLSPAAVSPELPAGATTAIDANGGEQDHAATRIVASRGGLDHAEVDVWEARRTEPSAAAMGKIDRSSLQKNVELATVDVRSGRVTRIAGPLYPLRYALSPDQKYLAYVEHSGHLPNNDHWVVVDLRIVALAEGREVSAATDLVTAGLPQRWALSWSPDSRSLAFVAKGKLGASALRADVDDCFLMGVKDRSFRNLTRGRTLALARLPEGPAWAEDGEALYFVNPGSGEDTAGPDNETLWRIAVRDGSASAFGRVSGRLLMSMVRATEDNLVGRFARHAGVLVETYDPHSRKAGFWILPRSGAAPYRLHEEPMFLGGFERAGRSNVLSHDGHTLIYTRESAREPPDLWQVRDTFDHPINVTALNPQLSNISFGGALTYQYRSARGEVLDGGILVPPGYQPGMRVPAVAWVYSDRAQSGRLQHFGLERGDPLGASLNAQVLAGRGYAVLTPESPRRRDHPAEDIVGSVVPAVDAAVSMGVIDPQRVAVIGHSYGGYMTAVLLTASERFKAGVALAGTYDLPAAFGSLGAGYFNVGQGRIHGSPWSNFEAFLRNSPTYRVDRMQAPLLLIHGELDGPWSADQLFNDLEYLGKEVVYARYRNEAHVFLYPANVLDNWERILGFLDKNLR